MNKDLQLFEQSVAKLPATAGEVFQYVRDTLIAKTRDLNDQVVQYSEYADRIVISDDAGMQEAVQHLQHRKRIDASIKDELGLIKDKAHKLHKGVCAAIDVLQKPLDGVDASIKGKMREYQREVERKAAEARAKAEEERRKRMAAAEKKVAGILEKMGTVEEKIAGVEAQLSRSDIPQEEHDALQSSFSALMAQKNSLAGKSEAIVEAAAAPIAPAPAPAPKIAGLSTKRAYVVEVRDLGRLIAAVVNGLVPIDVLKVNESALKKLANAGGVPSCRKGDMPGIPGCEITEDLSFSVRGGA